MTHDGTVEIDKDSGEVKHISTRESELSLSGNGKNESDNLVKKSGSGRKSKVNQLSRFKRSKKRYRTDKKILKQVKKPDPNSPHPNRLEFTDEERNNPELKRHIERSEKAVAKLEKATAELPKLRIERTFDEDSGRGKTRLTFKEEVKRPDTKLYHSPLNRPINEVAVFAHSKIHQVEKDNVGVESAHGAEKKTATKAVDTTKKAVNFIAEHGKVILESDYLDYDEYVYNLPQPLEFTHDPFMLTAFLSEIYEAFTYVKNYFISGSINL